MLRTRSSTHSRHAQDAAGAIEGAIGLPVFSPDGLRIVRQERLEAVVRLGRLPLSSPLGCRRFPEKFG